jgi:hypothetical protein
LTNVKNTEFNGREPENFGEICEVKGEEKGGWEGLEVMVGRETVSFFV